MTALVQEELLLTPYPYGTEDISCKVPLAFIDDDDQGTFVPALSHWWGKYIPIIPAHGLQLKRNTSHFIFWNSC